MRLAGTKPELPPDRPVISVCSWGGGRLKNIGLIVLDERS
jgi:hypothetical protein